jgi:hypothetical protein
MSISRSNNSLRENKVRMYVRNLLGGALSIALKVSQPLSMSSSLPRLIVYAEQVESK